MSRCTVPDTAPTPLSDERRVEPKVAGNGVEAAAAWMTTTGDPVEVRTRDRTGRWDAVHAIGGRNARDPAVTVAPDGTAYVIVQTYDAERRSSVVVYSSANGWRSGATISTGDGGARRPQIGVDARGLLTAIWVRDVGTSGGEVRTATRDARGRWSAPTSLSDVTRVGRTALAVAPDGTATATWEGGGRSDRRIEGAMRPADGRWTTAAVLSDTRRYATEPAVAAGNDGVVAATWLSHAGDGAQAHVSVGTRGEWAPAETLDRGDDLPLEMSRPGRASMAPAVVIAPDGEMAAAWSLTWDGVSAVRASRRITQRWTPPATVSGARNQSGGVSLALGPGARPLVAWEEIDGGLLRARVTSLDEPDRCADLVPTDGETAGVRVTGGARPTAVLVDFNRSRVIGTDLP